MPERLFFANPDPNNSTLTYLARPGEFFAPLVAVNSRFMGGGDSDELDLSQVGNRLIIEMHPAAIESIMHPDPSIAAYARRSYVPEYIAEDGTSRLLIQYAAQLFIANAPDYTYHHVGTYKPTTAIAAFSSGIVQPLNEKYNNG